MSDITEENGSRLNLRLSPQTRAAIQRISDKFGGISAADVVRRAIGTELFLIEEQEKGSRILVEDSKGVARQLILR